MPTGYTADNGAKVVMNHLYEDKNGGIHLCEGSQIHRDVYLVWTKCEKDVPANKSFKSKEVATCKSCISA